MRSVTTVELAPSGAFDATRRDWGRLSGLPRWLGRVTVWQYLLFSVIVVYTWYFTQVSLDVHNGLGTSAYDSALYDQGIWLLSRFHAPFVTLMGRNLFGDHASFILVFLVPVYWVYPHTSVLFFTQSLAVALGAVPVFLLARKRLHSEAVALLLAAVYLLHPAVTWINRENYHPDAYLGVFVGMAIYAAIERKWRLYAVFLVLAMLVKEDVCLVLVPLGIWVAVKRDRRFGIATICGSIAMTLFGMFAVMKSLIGVPTRNGWRIGPYGGPVKLMRETVERPGNVLAYLRSESRPFYLWQMTFPFAFVFARLPSVALISALVLFTNILANFWYQFHLEYHYSLIAVPALMMGTIWALAVMRKRARRWALLAISITSLWSALMWGALPIGKVLVPWADPPLGRDVGGYWSPDYVVPAQAREMMAEIPEGAVVSAQHSLTAHLAHRKQIYMFPNPFRVVLYGPNTDLENARARLPEADDVEYVMLQANLSVNDRADWDAVKADFREVDRNDFWVLYQRVGDTSG